MVEAVLQVGFVVTLVIASVVFLLQIIRQRTKKEKIAGSFPVLLSFLMLGWLGGELVSEFSPPQLAELSELIHFGVTIVFAIGITTRFRSSMKRVLV